MAYEIRDYSHQPGWVHYVSDGTTGLNDAWTSALPLDRVEAARLADVPKAKQFKSKSEARPFLDALKSARLRNWEEDGWLYRTKGYKKPAWKIYAVENQ